jgi:dCTP deaminase
LQGKIFFPARFFAGQNPPPKGLAGLDLVPLEGCVSLFSGRSPLHFEASSGKIHLTRTYLHPEASPRRKRRRMSIQSDRWIREQAIHHQMIVPFCEKQVAAGVISYGLSSYGYDLRVSDEFKIFTNVNSAIIDPKAFDERSFVSVRGDSVIVPPNSFALARSVEYFRIPRDVLTICVGKSTYARCGIIVNVTPFEPEWEGFVTLEISNTTPLPAKVYANEGLCQILFFRSDEPCQVSYADRKGKYQKQQGIVLPKL